MYQLISRKGCHLCQEAEALLMGLGVTFEWLDVDADPVLRSAYTFRVPVLLEGGEVIAEGRFDPYRLHQIIQR
jgi:glutaredoxin